MLELSFLDHIKADCIPLDRTDHGFEFPASESEDGKALAALLEDPRGAAFLSFIHTHSDFLTGVIRRDPEFLGRLCRLDVDAVREECLADVADLGNALSDETNIPDHQVMKELRLAKRKIALTTAIADILNLWPLSRITATLCDLAERTLDVAIERALSTWRGQPGKRGFVILGMGKLGAHELNYSSDIDLIVLYDPERLGVDDPDRLRMDMVRVTRHIMRIMDERTADGYVFRTDLRLRPDPGATPLALSVRAAESYYESLGQNWERAAMIKARPVAGDKAVGDAFLAHIRPFIWRKHLDFAAIQDIHSIKRQINAHRGGAQIAMEGHNIKIGRGGIREIEFFAQTQQLIWGGRQPHLRVHSTMAALDRLAETGHVDKTVTEDLKEAYCFLRMLEHRLQMVSDQQTQTLPDHPESLEKIARFAGFCGVGDFRAALGKTLGQVAQHYARLFEGAPDLGGSGSLVFTGTEDDPDTQQTLLEMGYETPSHITGRIRVWHLGRYRATRSERSRQILTELMPTLLEAFAKSAKPDAAFQQFDNFLSGLPSGVQLFALFQAHPALLDLVTEVLGGAPRLADWLSGKPALLDSVLDNNFFQPMSPPTLDDPDLHSSMDANHDFQDRLDAVRRWTNDQKFKAGVHLLRGMTDGDRIGPVLSGIAQSSLEVLLPHTRKIFCESHGQVPGGSMALLAFGKLGGRELLPMSDLDLVCLYDVPEGTEASDGPKPVSAQVYYQRLCQRIVTSISTETGEGRLYDVDLRLRPDGKSGALATQLSGFEAYYRYPQGEAWTWEHMALTRARPVYGPREFQERLTRMIRDILCQKRDPDQVIRDVKTMRERIRKEYPGTSAFDIKYRPGGLLDIEFIAQTLQLLYASQMPEILHTNTARALEALGAHRILRDRDTKILRQALGLWLCLQATLRLTQRGEFDPHTAPEGQRRALAHAAGVKSFDALEAHFQATSHQVSDIYHALFQDSFTGLSDPG